MEKSLISLTNINQSERYSQCYSVPPLQPFLYFISITDCVQEAEFGVSSRGSKVLFVKGFKFMVHRVLHNSTNWRCKESVKSRCRARAVTRWLNGLELVRLTNGTHSHPPTPTLEF